ncbi:hypothetical protein [Krasilnikovia sp. MM14-A1259]|uniref:hypothetical protein n=1 Tax=Krasilnikovia sp. MM14-A1259 TaxID=3373539 RepID=UPI00381DD6DC
MIVTRLRRSAPLLLAAGTLAAVLSPGVALADGPGYGGTADALTVQWHGKRSADGVAVYAVGFRAGSTVDLRVGSAPNRKVAADAFGGLRVLMVAAGAVTSEKPPTGTAVVPVEAAATGGRLSSGTVVQAIGQSPAGSVRTLVGAVPPPDAGGGVSAVMPWTGAAAVLVGIGVLMRRLRPSRPVEAAGVQRHRYAPRHRS